jgi:hypothetical protein
LEGLPLDEPAPARDARCPGMNAYRGGDVAITVIEASGPPKLFVSWRGRGNEREPHQTLGPFLRSVVDRAAESQATIELHCQDITYINAATIGCMVEMIHWCEASQVPVTLRYARASGWQKLSFEALRVLVKNTNQLIVEGV